MNVRETRAALKLLLSVSRDVARANIHTDPTHAGAPNHRADEELRDILEEVLHESE